MCRVQLCTHTSKHIHVTMCVHAEHMHVQLCVQEGAHACGLAGAGWLTGALLACAGRGTRMCNGVLLARAHACAGRAPKLREAPLAARPDATGRQNRPEKREKRATAGGGGSRNARRGGPGRLSDHSRTPGRPQDSRGGGETPIGTPVPQPPRRAPTQSARRRPSPRTPCPHGPPQPPSSDPPPPHGPPRHPNNPPKTRRTPALVPPRGPHPRPVPRSPQAAHLCIPGPHPPGAGIQPVPAVPTGTKHPVGPDCPVPRGPMGNTSRGANAPHFPVGDSCHVSPRRRKGLRGDTGPGDPGEQPHSRPSPPAPGRHRAGHNRTPPHRGPGWGRSGKQRRGHRPEAAAAPNRTSNPPPPPPAAAHRERPRRSPGAPAPAEEAESPPARYRQPGKGRTPIWRSRSRRAAKPGSDPPLRTRRYRTPPVTRPPAPGRTWVRQYGEYMAAVSAAAGHGGEGGPGLPGVPGPGVPVPAARGESLPEVGARRTFAAGSAESAPPPPSPAPWPTPSPPPPDLGPPTRSGVPPPLSRDTPPSLWTRPRRDGPRPCRDGRGGTTRGTTGDRGRGDTGPPPAPSAAPFLHAPPGGGTRSHRAPAGERTQEPLRVPAGDSDSDSGGSRERGSAAR